jgi:hypothetical protein
MLSMQQLIPTRADTGGPGASTRFAASLGASIVDIDFSSLVDSFLEHDVASDRSSGNGVLTELMRYLILKVMSNEENIPGAITSPSDVIEQAWRTFLLHTKLYRRVCAAWTGEEGGLIHHDPDTSQNDSAHSRYAHTHRFYSLVFGCVPDETYWPKPSDHTSSSAQSSVRPLAKRRRFGSEQEKETQEVQVDDSFYVFMTNVSVRGSQFSIECPGGDTTVSELKTLYREFLDIPEDELQIIFRKKKLQDHRTLSQNNIGLGSMLHVVRQRDQGDSKRPDPCGQGN